MAKIDPKVLLAVQAPASPGAYPVAVELEIRRDDWGAYEALTAKATLAWQDKLVASYLGRVGLKEVNHGAKFCPDMLSPKDKRAVACAKAVFVAEEAQASWSGKSRGDILFLRAALFAMPSKRMCSTGILKVLPRSGKVAVTCPIDDALHARIEELEGHPVPRVKWTAALGKNWSTWTESSLS